MAFVIKQNDTLPRLPFQIFQPDGITPLDLTNATTIYICVRNRVTPDVNFKQRAVIADRTRGIGYYAWTAEDTEFPGEYQYEFEIVWADLNVQTVPVDGYLDLVIVDDIA